ncbi:MAG: hypothetical protein R3C59_12915 [Planctomycetaceae bacterium]
MDRVEVDLQPSTVKGYRCENRTCSGVASMAITPGGRLWVAWYTGTTRVQKLKRAPMRTLSSVPAAMVASRGKKWWPLILTAMDLSKLLITAVG